MSRTLTPALLAKLQAQARTIVHLLQVELDSATYYLTDAYRDLTYDGHTYTRLGHFLGFDGIEESSRLEVQDCAISLSLVDRGWASLLLGESYINRQVKIYLAALDASNALVADPVLMLHGYIDEPTIQDDPETGMSVAAIKVVNHLADIERRAGRFTDDGTQQFWFPGDRFFEYAAQTGKKYPGVKYTKS